MSTLIMKSICISFVLVALLGNAHSFAQPTFERRDFRVDCPIGIATGDFNNDTFLDIAISDDFIVPGLQHQQQTLMNDGTGNFTWLLSAVAFTAAHQELVVGHFDSDNFLDIIKPIGANVPARGAAIPLKGVGNGRFNFLGSLYDTGTDWPRNITSADFDADGSQDVAVAAVIDGFGSDLVSVLLGDGNLGFASPNAFFVGLTPKGIIANDFNGDSKPDLAVVLSGEDNVAILLGVGDECATGAI